MRSGGSHQTTVKDTTNSFFFALFKQSIIIATNQSRAGKSGVIDVIANILDTHRDNEEICSAGYSVLENVPFGCK